ncbi:MAG TPA: 1-(5-phosphoribosyl)-5-[(5-phosphoribosylamino)methylideneamino]imidazole-4-carboxamide isomerase [Clostridia bacterium]|nr:1-(5-phosphoribosyl)-5-[(5-phosphoribosylamino)methylideneamino]imidazole-4-carboxamide isomerase [Clostridia bacterium]
MYIYPAIDVKNGKCVRLVQGDANRETIYHENPIEVAKQWEGMGAKFLHIVDLDGAFQGESQNLAIIEELITSISIPVQIGGGIRTMDNIDRLLKYPGVARVILGTSAITQRELLETAIETYGNRIAVGIDAKDGKVAIRGWVEKTEIDAVEFGKQIKEIGVDTVIYTDISKDGMLLGPNLSATQAMIQETGLNIIASGGVSKLDDLAQVRQIGASGVIIGQALYTGAIDLIDALEYEEE